MGKHKITNQQRLEHILDAIGKIEHYCNSVELNKFLENEVAVKIARDSNPKMSGNIYRDNKKKFIDWRIKK